MRFLQPLKYWNGGQGSGECWWAGIEAPEVGNLLFGYWGHHPQTPSLHRPSAWLYWPIGQGYPCGRPDSSPCWVVGYVFTCGGPTSSRVERGVKVYTCGGLMCVLVVGPWATSIPAVGICSSTWAVVQVLVLLRGRGVTFLYKSIPGVVSICYWGLMPPDPHIRYG